MATVRRVTWCLHPSEPRGAELLSAPPGAMPYEILETFLGGAHTDSNQRLM